jgi:hypothetical protein
MDLLYGQTREYLLHLIRIEQLIIVCMMQERIVVRGIRSHQGKAKL